MRTIIAMTLLLVVSVTSAQQAVGTPEQIKQFLGTTTYVVLESNPLLTYNTEIRNTVEKHWKITPYEFVTYSSDEWEKVRKDPTKSFLLQTTVFYSKDKTKAKYDFLSIELGGDYKLETDMPDIANIPISYDGVDEETFGYKLGMMCRFLQNHITITQENPGLNSKKMLKYYYKNMTGNVKNKTLYVTETDLATGFGMPQIKSVYPGKVELVSREQIAEAIDNQDENIVFVHKVGPEGSKRKARCYNTIIGAGDAKLYYFSWHMIDAKNPEGLLGKDWKKLAKAK